MSTSGWIAVDLDGTLAEYHGWVNTFHIGPPIPAMLDRVKRWLSEGRDVRIFTARVDGGGTASKMGVDPEIVKKYEDREAITRMIQDWTEKHIGVRLPVTNAKDYGMIELWDDRCVQVIPNTGKRADGQDCEIKQSTLREAAIAICPLCAGGNKYVSREPLLESEHTVGKCRWFHRYSDTNEIAARCEAWKINDLIVKVTE